MPLKDSIYLRTLHQTLGITVYNIINNPHKYPTLAKFPERTLYRHAKKPLEDEQVDGRKKNKGRPKLMSQRDQNAIKRNISKLRISHGTFTSKDLQQAAGLTEKMSNFTFRRGLHKMGYKWRNTRRKGRLLPSDLKLRLNYCRKMKRQNLAGNNLWTEGIALYIDGVGFEYKQNPHEHARALGSREWRMVNEGLNINCTAKGMKEGKTCVKFMVGMSYGKGVVTCIPLTQRMCGQYYTDLIKSHFREALRLSGKTCNRILQDGDPSQNSKLARNELNRQHISLFSIPPRSPDLNPIENLFNQVRRTIKEDSLQKQLEYESRNEFTARVGGLLLSYSVERINKLILSMPKRIDMVIAAKGQRIKY